MKATASGGQIDAAPTELIAMFGLVPIEIMLLWSTRYARILERQNMLQISQIFTVFRTLTFGHFAFQGFSGRDLGPKIY
jgi:hypothetical protein